MDKQISNNQKMTMRDFAWQDKRSIHAALHGYGDGREKRIKEADLDKQLLTDQDIEDAKVEPMGQSEARKLLHKILFHGAGVAGCLFALEKFVK